MPLWGGANPVPHPPHSPGTTPPLPPFLYRSVLHCTGKSSCKNVVLKPRARPGLVQGPGARAVLVQEASLCKNLVLEPRARAALVQGPGVSHTCEGPTVVQEMPLCKNLVLELNVGAALVQGPGARVTLVQEVFSCENLVLWPRAIAAQVQGLSARAALVQEPLLCHSRRAVCKRHVCTGCASARTSCKTCPCARITSVKDLRRARAALV